MPAIPQYQSQGLPQGGIRFGQTATGGLGEGLQKAGQALATVAQAGLDAKVAREEQEQATAANAWASGARGQWMDTLQRAKDEAGADPSGFTSRVSADYQTYVQQSLNQPGLSDYQKQRMEAAALDLGETIHAHALAFETQGRVAFRKTQISDSLNKLANVAARDPTQYEDLYRLGSETISQSGLPASEQSALMSAWKSDAVKSMLQGQLEKNPGAVISALDRGVYDDRLDAGARAALYNAAQATQRTLQAETRANTVSATTLLKGVQDLMQAGYELAPEQKQQVDAAVAASASPSVKTYWTQLQENQSVVRQASRMNPMDLNNFIQTQVLPGMQDGGATTAEFSLYQTLQNVAKQQTDSLKSDPLSYAARVGVATLQPLDTSTPEAARTSLMARIVEANKAASQFGTQPVLLTESEVTALAAAGGGVPQQALSIAETLRDMGDTAALRSFSRQIAPQNPTLAYVTAMPPALAAGRAAAVRGFAALKARPDLVPEMEMKNQLDKALPPAALRGFAPEVQAQMLGAVKAIVADGLSRGQTLNDLVPMAVEAGVGRVDTINGGAVILSPGLDGNDLQRTINGLTEAEVARLSARGVMPVDDRNQPVAVTDLRDYLPLTGAAGWLAFTDRRGAPLRGSDGQPFLLHLDAETVKETLEGRKR